MFRKCRHKGVARLQPATQFGNEKLSGKARRENITVLGEFGNEGGAVGVGADEDFVVEDFVEAQQPLLDLMTLGLRVDGEWGEMETEEMEEFLGGEDGGTCSKNSSPRNTWLYTSSLSHSSSAFRWLRIAKRTKDGRMSMEW